MDCVYVLVQSRLSLCYPTDCSLPGSSVHWISEARILEWCCLIHLQGNLPKPGTESVPPAAPALAGRFFTPEPSGKPIIMDYGHTKLGLLYGKISMFIITQL